MSFYVRLKEADNPHHKTLLNSTIIHSGERRYISIKNSKVKTPEISRGKHSLSCSPMNSEYWDSRTENGNRMKTAVSELSVGTVKESLLIQWK